MVAADSNMGFYQDVIWLIRSGNVQSKDDLHRAKLKLCSKYNMGHIPADSKILEYVPKDISEQERQQIVRVLQRKKMRTISGVAVVAVMTSPSACPHGKCIPCPGGVEYHTPQSYTGFEPAAMRGELNEFDPYLETRNRLEQLQAIGHPIDKIDLIVMGGTFTSRHPAYQKWFVKRCFDGLNNGTSKSLQNAQLRNEQADSRCIGLTIETRPDWCRLQHVDHMLDYGATRAELGVQTTYDAVLYEMNRGHTVTDSIQATRILKDAGLKVCYHMMPGLPGSNEHMDEEAFRTIFEDPHFKPDMIKIYPTLVVKNTALWKQWKNKRYQPLSTEKAKHLIARIKEFVPRWVRIQRVQRDVPAPHIEAGVQKSNLRQLVQKEMEQHGWSCDCIRCHEIGHQSLEKDFDVDEEEIRLYRRNYNASEGTEVFLSVEDPIHDVVIGYLRLREVGRPHREELIGQRCMIIRELKVVGKELPVGKKAEQEWQHKGYGKLLIQEAERICAEEFDCKHLFVLSGIGVKPYYRNLGFTDKGVYLKKNVR